MVALGVNSLYIYSKLFIQKGNYSLYLMSAQAHFMYVYVGVFV